MLDPPTTLAVYMYVSLAVDVLHVIQIALTTAQPSS
jgi:hypothetical protein